MKTRPTFTTRTATGHVYCLARWHVTRSAPADAAAASIIVDTGDGYRSAYRHTGERSDALAALGAHFVRRGLIAIARGPCLIISPMPADFWLDPDTGEPATPATATPVANLTRYPAVYY